MRLWECLREAGGSGDGCKDDGGGWFVWENGGGGCKSVWNVSVCVNKHKNPVRHERFPL